MNVSKLNSAVEGVINAVARAKAFNTPDAKAALEDSIAYLIHAAMPLDIRLDRIAAALDNRVSTESKVAEGKTAAAQVRKELDAIVDGQKKNITDPEALYGYCPDCGGKGVTRERTINGFDTCENKHKYLSSDASTYPSWQDKPKVTLSGRPAELDKAAGAPAAIDPATGQFKDYWVLPESERAKGFVRPYRYSYTHDTCGTVTTMGRDLSETYARDPKYYGSTFCYACREHFPVGQFKWTGTKETVGS